jgi:hypothetical protein
MTDMMAVTCRKCGEVNFVGIESRDLVHVPIPVELFDEYMRWVSRRLTPTQQKRRNAIPDGDVLIARELRSRGLTIRQIMAETGWSLGSAARRIELANAAGS